MDTSLIFIVLSVLTFSAALNLFLTMRLAARVRSGLAPATTALSLPVGKEMPPFEGRLLADGAQLKSIDFAGKALVLVFMSSACSKCKTTIPELCGILPAMRRAGVTLWISSQDSINEIAELLEDSPLLAHLMVLDTAAHKRLNPLGAVPQYIFVDDEMIVQASSYVGDEDWQSFVQQMRDIDAEEMIAQKD